MPIYAYLCDGCGHELEVIQKISDKALVDCPACAEPRLKKQLTAAGFQLKGSGWYATDFKGAKKKSDNGKEEAKSDSSSDSAKGACGGGTCGCHS